MKFVRISSTWCVSCIIMNKVWKQLLDKYPITYVGYFSKLAEFTRKYPNTGCEWNDQYPDMKDKFEDEFLTAHFDLERIGSEALTFTKNEDQLLSNLKTKRYGELYDYVEFYRDSILCRTAVNIDELNPLYRTIVDKEREIDKGPVLRRVK